LRRIKKDKPEEEECEQLPPELEEETWPWWVEHRELQATLSRHPNDPEDRRRYALETNNKSIFCVISHLFIILYVML
jgi:hypothetical protein